MFVGLAEEHGLVDGLLDRMVATGALLASGAWRSAGADVNVAVNLSFRNLHRLRLPEEIERQAKSYGVPLRSCSRWR